MKNLKMTLAICAAVLMGTITAAEASNQSPIHLLKLSYDQERSVLLERFRALREEVECARRDALTELRLARAEAVRLCEPHRSLAMRQLRGRRREIMLRYRADLVDVRNEHEIHKKQLKRAYDVQLSELRLRPVIATQVTVVPAYTGPKCATPTCPTPTLPAPQPQAQGVWEYGHYRGGESIPPQVIAPEVVGPEVIAPEVILPEPTELLIPEWNEQSPQPLFRLNETGSYIPQRPPAKEISVRLGRLGVIRIGI